MKKDDTVEYVSILKPSTSQVVSVSLDTIASMISITSITLDDQPVSADTLTHLTLTGSSVLKVSGVARATGMLHDTVDSTIRVTTVASLASTGISSVDTTAGSGTVSLTPPTGIQLSATGFSSQINNLLQIDGNSLDSITYVNIGEQSFVPTLRDGYLYVGIPQGTFASGDYFVFFQLKNGQVVPTDTEITFEYGDTSSGSGGIGMANITPSEISNEDDQFIVVQGHGFKKIVSIQLNNSIILRNVEFQIINDQVLAVHIPRGLPVSQYFFNIMTTDSIAEVRNVSFTVTP